MVGVDERRGWLDGQPRWRLMFAHVGSVFSLLIALLERAGLIHRSVRGRQHVCRLSPQPLEYAVEWLKTSQQFWEERLDALEEHLALHDHE